MAAIPPERLRRAARLLAAGLPQRDAAAAASMGERTLRNYLNDPAFQQMLSDARSDQPADDRSPREILEAAARGLPVSKNQLDAAKALAAIEAREQGVERATAGGTVVFEMQPDEVITDPEMPPLGTPRLVLFVPPGYGEAPAPAPETATFTPGLDTAPRSEEALH